MKQDWGKSCLEPLFLFGSNNVFRKNFLEESGYYDERYKTNFEDVDISRRIRKMGFSLIYEPSAIVRHIKSDNISSLFNNYWNWNLEYSRQEGFYNNRINLMDKIKDNIGLANRYIDEDIVSGRKELLYLDFLLSMHHSLKDLKYYLFSEENIYSDNPEVVLDLWLSFIDLDFFFSFDSKKNIVSTLIPERNKYYQNFIAAVLAINASIRRKFDNQDFIKIFYKHLFESVLGISDKKLLERIFVLTERQSEWRCLYVKKQKNLENVFLEKISLFLQDWIRGFDYNKPELVSLINSAAVKIDSSIH